MNCSIDCLSAAMRTLIFDVARTCARLPNEPRCDGLHPVAVVAEGIRAAEDGRDSFFRACIWSLEHCEVSP